MTPNTMSFNQYLKIMAGQRLDPALHQRHKRLIRQFGNEVEQETDPVSEQAIESMLCMLAFDQKDGDKAIDALTARFRLEKLRRDLLANIGPHNTVAILVFQTDCDQCAWTTVYDIEPTVDAYHDLRDHLEEGREGQLSLSIMSPKDAEDYQCWSRDLALEAYENGHPHCVHL